MHRGIIVQRSVIHHICPHAKRHRLVIRLVQGHEGLRLILMAAAGKRPPAAVAKASAAPVLVAERQRVADIAVVRGVAGVVAAAGVGGVAAAADAGVVVGVAGVLAGVAQVGGESLLPRSVFIIGELGGVPAHIAA